MPEYSDKTTETKKFSQYIDTLKDDWEYAVERVLLDIAEQIVREMEKKSISKAELAKRLGVSRAYISQFFSIKSNLRLSSLYKIAFAIGLEPKIELKSQPIPKYDKFVLLKFFNRSFTVSQPELKFPLLLRLKNEYEPQTHTK